jgi:hypothetical protein
MTIIEIAITAALFCFFAGLALAACMLDSRVDQDTDATRAKAASDAAEDERRRDL